MRKVIGMFVVAGALLVTACNTIDGAGKDVSSAGDAVSNTVQDIKN